MNMTADQLETLWLHVTEFQKTTLAIIEDLRAEQREIATLLGCDDFDEITTPSNLPNVIRDLLAAVRHSHEAFRDSQIVRQVLPDWNEHGDLPKRKASLQSDRQVTKDENREAAESQKCPRCGGTVLFGSRGTLKCDRCEWCGEK